MKIQLKLYRNEIYVYACTFLFKYILQIKQNNNYIQKKNRKGFNMANINT